MFVFINLICDSAAQDLTCFRDNTTISCALVSFYLPVQKCLPVDIQDITKATIIPAAFV